MSTTASKPPETIQSEEDQSTAGSPWRRGWSLMVGKAGMVPALVLIIVVGAALSDNFLTATNMSNVIKSAAVIGLLAVGQTFVIIGGGGGIDLSVGAVLAAAGVAGALFQDQGLLVVILVTLGTGAYFGLINGLGVTTAGLQPFIVTLGTLTIARGVAFFLSNATPIRVAAPGLEWVGRGTIGPIPTPIAIFAVAVIIGQFVLSKTVFGRELYAIGGNAAAAYLSGVPVNRRRLTLYVISGLMAGTAALIAVSRLNTADANLASGFELDAIAAVVVGGAPLTGGRGTILGTSVGVLIIALFGNLLNLMNVDPWTQQIVKGLIVILVVALNRRGRIVDSLQLQGLPLYAALVVGGVLLFLLPR